MDTNVMIDLDTNVKDGYECHDGLGIWNVGFDCVN